MPMPETQKIPPPEPGFHRDVSFEDYLAWDACSASTLTDLKDRSPAFCRMRAQSGSISTPAQVLGSAGHAAILELGAFESRYAVKQQCEAYTKGGAGPQCSKGGVVRRSGLWYCGTKGHDPSPRDLPEVEAISRSQELGVLGMREAVYQVPAARDLLDSCEDKEISIVWKDRKTGVLCKARPDGLDTERRICMNLKTTQLVPDRWTRYQAGLGLERSMAFYLEGLTTLALDDLGVWLSDRIYEYRILVVMSDPPHEVVIHTPHPDLIELGRRQNEPLLQRYAGHLESGLWPAVLESEAFLVWDEWRMREGLEVAVTIGGKPVR